MTEDGLVPFINAMAFQQFWTQKKFYKGDFARFNYFFRNEEKLYSKDFKSHYGISISIYTDMLVAIWVFSEMISNQIYIKCESILASFGFEKESITHFLKISSRTTDELKIDISEMHQRINSPILQYGEHTPLFRYPILKIKENDYIVYSKRILENALILNIFLFIKEHGSDKSIADFANIFEQYINDLLSSSHSVFKTENELVRKYDGKVTDFLITEKNWSIMIEAKSIRLSDLERANPTKDVILNALKGDVVKAIFQAQELSNYLYKKQNHQNFALIIVCYDDIHLGSPYRAYKEYFESYCESKYLSGERVRGHVPPENIFIVSVRDFESICTHRKTIGNFSSILEKAIKDNHDPQTEKFSLVQALPDIKITKGLDVINTNFNELWKHIIYLAEHYGDMPNA
jgi:hypothetical protein